MIEEVRTDNRDLVAGLVRSGVLRTPMIAEAFKAVDRKDFVLPQLADQAYANQPLGIGFGQTISQPWTVAFMMELLQPQPRHVILDIGSGSGWTTTLLAYIASANKTTDGRVYGVEIVKELCGFGEANCAKYNFIGSGVAQFLCYNGSLGLPGVETVDRILCSAALPSSEIPVEWRRQIAIGGRIVAPIKNDIMLFTRVSADEFSSQRFNGFAFVPFVKL